jgi:glucose/arabinose dehydrogenase
MSLSSPISKSFLTILVLLLAAQFAVGQKTLKFLPLPEVQLVPVLTGIAQPVLVRGAGDGTKRLFVVLQRGRILVHDPAAGTTGTFLDIATKVNQTGSERGLLGLAFHPQFAENRYFFINYTRASDGSTIIARYRANEGNLSALASSERILMTISQPYTNHNGGMIDFGHDGFLYIGMGDGGSANDPGARAQNINNLHGKILRIDPDVSGDDSNPAYSIPPTNPFAGPIAGLDEIYAVGLRNPWRWSFDRATGDLWLADVGQNAIEEVNKVVLGGNYGWRVYEGDQCTNIEPTNCVAANYSMPVFQYNHTGGRCSVTGGYVYRGGRRATFPNGTYIYGDYCTGEIFLWRGRQQLLIDTTRFISSFGQDDEGEIYVVGIGSSSSATGTVEKFVKVGN